ncbi:MAG: GNAT family N-acetyltransferase [Azospirillum sp.]|nr:GNAT family N-acetyltransferase [Azospirillum sp.]
MKIAPVVLEGEHVRLVPLESAHAEGIAALLDDTLTAYFQKPFRTLADARAMIDDALMAQAAGTALAFTTIERASGRIAGGSRFLNIRSHDRVAEIGFTYVGRAFQRSAVNTEAKLLMLGHAFDAWAANRVEFKTDSLNVQSRAALARLGAVEEGTLRNHMLMSDGRLRHSVYFSVLPAEWPAVRDRLRARLQRGGTKS